MSLEDNISLVQRFYEGAKSGNLDDYDEIFAEDFVSHKPNGQKDIGPAGMKAFINGLRQRTTGIWAEVHEIFADGDKVAARLTVRGTAVATGAPVAVYEIHMYRVANGKLVERWSAVKR